MQLEHVKVKKAKAKSNSLDFVRFRCANSQDLFRFLCANSLDLLSFFLVLKGMKTKGKNQTSKGPGRCFFLCVCAAPPDEPHRLFIFLCANSLVVLLCFLPLS